MASTWRRPGMTGIEVLWRWAVGIPFLWFLSKALLYALRVHPVNAAALEAMTAFQPMEALTTLNRELAPLLPPLWTTLRWLVPAAIAVWTVFSTAGRLAIWRRLEPALLGRRGVVALLGLLRLMLLLLFFWLWIRGIRAAANYSLLTAVSRGAEPNVVLFAALLVVLTLLLFLLWSLVVWPLDAAPLFALTDGEGVLPSLRSALRASALRSKLVEINLVMGIVKVGLLVLAMVFSATPLPFAAEETQGFLISWWSFVGVLFLLSLDFFHVVRRAANLAFFRALVTQKNDTGIAGERAY